MRYGARTILVLGMVALTTTACATAQRIQDRMEDEVDERVDDAIDNSVEGSADKAEEGAEEVVDRVLNGRGDAAGAAGDAGAPPARRGTDAAGTGTGAMGADQEAQGLALGSEAWANYDFVPGERVLAYEDFENELPGNFPRGLHFVEGNLEVVEWQDGLYLRVTGNSRFDIALPETLPDRFTLEFKIHSPGGGDVFVMPEVPERSHVYYERAYLNIDGDRVGVNDHRGEGVQSMTDVGDAWQNDLIQVRLMADGPYVKAYVGRERVANVPNADFARGDTLRFEVEPGRSAESGAFIDDIRVAAGGRRITYDALMRNGRLATRAILFETGSARIRGESTQALDDIARVLDRHPDLSLVIEGHTDDVGTDQANRSLSLDRAEAVRTALVQRYGVEAGRLSAVGLGESQPVASNETPEGRQSNRRVELVVDDEGM